MSVVYKSELSLLCQPTDIVKYKYSSQQRSQYIKSEENIIISGIIQHLESHIMPLHMAYFISWTSRTRWAGNTGFTLVHLWPIMLDEACCNHNPAKYFSQKQSQTEERNPTLIGICMLILWAWYSSILAESCCPTQEWTTMSVFNHAIAAHHKTTCSLPWANPSNNISYAWRNFIWEIFKYTKKFSTETL